jgi:hypothetical protein
MIVHAIEETLDKGLQKDGQVVPMSGCSFRIPHLSGEALISPVPTFVFGVCVTAPDRLPRRPRRRSDVVLISRSGLPARKLANTSHSISAEPTSESASSLSRAGTVRGALLHLDSLHRLGLRGVSRNEQLTVRQPRLLRGVPGQLHQGQLGQDREGRAPPAWLHGERLAVAQHYLKNIMCELRTDSLLVVLVPMLVSRTRHPRICL